MLAFQIETELDSQTPSLPLLQATTSGKLAKAEEERQFFKQLNDTLLANQRDFQVGLAGCRGEFAGQSAQVAGLGAAGGCCWWVPLCRSACPSQCLPLLCPQAQARLKAAEERLAATAAEKDATIADLQDQVGTGAWMCLLSG